MEKRKKQLEPLENSAVEHRKRDTDHCNRDKHVWRDRDDYIHQLGFDRSVVCQGTEGML